MALGASSQTVRRLVLGDALVVAAAGAVTGFAGCMAMGGLIRAMLFEVQPLDAPTLLCTALTLLMASAAAAYVPVRRATRVAPSSLLRSE
jgi:ABC-type antimicrobial peptide transport system permease subunit